MGKIKKDDLYIAILKYGKEHLGENVTPEGLIKHLKENKYDFNADGNDFKRLYLDVFSLREGRGFGYDRPSIMKMEAYFRLLEHEELQDARESSKEARKYAVIAIWISIFAMIISITISIIQLNTSTKIDDAQFQKLIQPVPQLYWQADE